MTIRDASPADAPAIAAIYNDAVVNTTAIWNEHQVDAANRRAWLAERQGHFFPPALLASQFAALEPLQPDEDAVTVDLTLTPQAQVEAALSALGLRDAAQ